MLRRDHLRGGHRQNIPARCARVSSGGALIDLQVVVNSKLKLCFSWRSHLDALGPSHVLAIHCLPSVPSRYRQRPTRRLLGCLSRSHTDQMTQSSGCQTPLRRNNQRIGRSVFAMRASGVADVAHEKRGSETSETKRWAWLESLCAVGVGKPIKRATLG
jgi:hypothetical protein